MIQVLLSLGPGSFGKLLYEWFDDATNRRRRSLHKSARGSSHKTRHTNRAQWRATGRSNVWSGVFVRTHSVPRADDQTQQLLRAPLTQRLLTLSTNDSETLLCAGQSLCRDRSLLLLLRRWLGPFGSESVSGSPPAVYHHHHHYNTARARGSPRARAHTPS